MTEQDMLKLAERWGNQRAEAVLIFMAGATDTDGLRVLLEPDYIHADKVLSAMYAPEHVHVDEFHEVTFGGDAA